MYEDAFDTIFSIYRKWPEVIFLNFDFAKKIIELKMDDFSESKFNDFVALIEYLESRYGHRI